MSVYEEGLTASALLGGSAARAQKSYASVGNPAGIVRQTVFGRITSTVQQTAIIATRIEALESQFFGTDSCEATCADDTKSPSVIGRAFDDLDRIDNNLDRITRAIVRLEELLP